jgi:hypothetical protein
MIEPLTSILTATASPQSLKWLTDTLDRQKEVFHQRQFYYAFSGATRHFAKTPVTVTPQQAAQLHAEIPGFTVETWTEDQVARCVLLLLLARQPSEVFQEALTALIGHADMREAAAIYAAFPLLPEPAFLLPLAREALRSNIVSVFDALALRNPFPADHFADDAWNQMILKCFFLQRPTHFVIGLDRRANADLSRALFDYAHERWAAHRPVTPDLWRSSASFVNAQIAEDLAHAADSPVPGNRQAVALVAAASNSPLLDSLRTKLSPELEQIRKGHLTWNSLGALLYPSV